MTSNDQSRASPPKEVTFREELLSMEEIPEGMQCSVEKTLNASQSSSEGPSSPRSSVVVIHDKLQCDDQITAADIHCHEEETSEGPQHDDEETSASPDSVKEDPLEGSQSDKENSSEGARCDNEENGEGPQRDKQEQSDDMESGMEGPPKEVACSKQESFDNPQSGDEDPSEGEQCHEEEALEGSSCDQEKNEGGPEESSEDTECNEDDITASVLCREVIFDERDLLEDNIDLSLDPHDWSLFQYPMDHENRGVAIIFNNGSFESRLELGNRAGYEEDGEMMKEAFAKMHFDVRYYKDMSAAGIQTTLHLLAREGHRDADCLAVVFMTYGADNTDYTDLIYARDRPISIRSAVNRFTGSRCPSLIGKPKLFFVQACRAPNVDSVGSSGDDEGDGFSRTNTKLLKEADVILSYSTLQGNYPFKTGEVGSVYIRHLCRVLMEFGSRRDILWLLSLVNWRVAYTFASGPLKMSKNKKNQMPAIITTLTRQVLFPVKENWD